MDSRRYRATFSINAQPIYRTTFTAPPGVEIVGQGFTETRQLNNERSQYTDVTVEDITDEVDCTDCGRPSRPAALQDGLCTWCRSDPEGNALRALARGVQHPDL